MPTLPKESEIGVQSLNEHQHGQLSQLPTLDSVAIEQDPWIRIANIHTKRDTAATPNNLSPDHRSIEVFGMIGMVVGIVSAIAGILALFKGWKFWKRKVTVTPLSCIKGNINFWMFLSLFIITNVYSLA